MIFTETPLKGAYVIDPERHEDERGFFARTWCRREAASHGLDPDVVQGNLSYNVRKGTLRGMHYQLPPCAEAKLVRCSRGAIFDVIVDLRPDSATFLQWYGTELTAGNYRMLFVPRYFAHGFMTLEDSTEIAYQMSEYYAPGYGSGIRWDDPQIAIAWPMRPRVISARDDSYPYIRPEDVRTAMAGNALTETGLKGE